MRKASKEYKAAVNKAYNDYQHKAANELREVS